MLFPFWNRIYRLSMQSMICFHLSKESFPFTLFFSILISKFPFLEYKFRNFNRFMPFPRNNSNKKIFKIQTIIMYSYHQSLPKASLPLLLHYFTVISTLLLEPTSWMCSAFLYQASLSSITINKGRKREENLPSKGWYLILTAVWGWNRRTRKWRK